MIGNVYDMSGRVEKHSTHSLKRVAEMRKYMSEENKVYKLCVANKNGGAGDGMGWGNNRRINNNCARPLG